MYANSFNMGTLFSSCTKANDRECSSSQEETLAKEKRTRRKKKEKSSKTRKSLRTSEAKDKLSLTSVKSCSSACRKSKSSLSKRAQSTVDLTVIGRAIPILEAPITTEFEPRASNTQVIRVQPNNTSDYSSEESSQCTGLKKPLTGTETSASLLTPPVVEASHCESFIDPVCHGEESNKSVPTGQISKEQETPARSSHSQLLELLRIRLDMAANNMEINRLMTNVDRALDRTTRALELGFRRIMAARKSRRIHALSQFQEQSTAMEEEMDYNEDEEETGTTGEESCGEDDDSSAEFETEGGDESDEEGEIRPPLRPRICWQ